MTSFLKRSIPLIIVLCIGGVLLVLLRTKPAPTPVVLPATETKPVSPILSVLAEMPDWASLNAFQNTITRTDFERLLTTVFVTGGAWRNFIELDDNGARILTGTDPASDVFHLRFAPEGLAEPTPRHWKPTSELPPAPPGKPLQGLHIAIDPGHIGGEWAKVEERWLSVENGKPICEGDMTLMVANLLKPRLEALGARISLVRDKPEPVTPLRPESLLTLAKDSTGAADSPAALRKFAERLFYRTAEIRARADLVNDTLQPDLVLCLHFNADPWGDPNNPTLVDRSHLHLLLNGAYTDEEVSLADQRHALLEKLLRRTHEEEAFVGATVADVFAQTSGLPPFIYPQGSLNALPVRGHPYLWARNLLANRLYDCPVIFMEPYVMNSIIDHPRLQAGDYEGLREVGGKLQPSIFREYSDALVKGLETHYTTHRATTP
jgi:N-acetylmuramoyl-L-alanine amidase